MRPIASYSLYSWQHRQPWLRMVAPWQAAGLEFQAGTQWDQVSYDPIASAGVIHLHRDFPRLFGAYLQVVERARTAGNPIILDLDEDLFNLPHDHPDRQFHYRSDALFPVLQAVIEADAVTVSTPALFEAIQPLNPNTHLLPTYLDDRLWSFKLPQSRDKNFPFIVGWINDQRSEPAGFVEGIMHFLRRIGKKALLRVFGMKPPTVLLDLVNVDWLPALPLTYSKFIEELSQQKCDLMVVPHCDHPYYRSQSPVRFFEISACGIPGIYSRVTPYREVISHEVNGWLANSADEWDRMLDMLIGSDAVCQQTAANAQDTVRNEWLLTTHAESWLDLYQELTKQATPSNGKKLFTGQAVELAGQVRAWQRDLEEQIYQREWEVRALNVMMKRKEREAGEYTDQLNAQLQSVWDSPTYRLLDKVRHPKRIFSTPVPRPVTSANPPETSQESSPPGGSLTLGNLPRARSYDVILLSGTDHENAFDPDRKFLNSFIKQGSRVFQITLSSSENGSVQPGEGGFTSVQLPIMDDSEFQRTFFENLRQDAGIYEAICWIEGTTWLDLAFHLRNWFGWKAVAAVDLGKLSKPFGHSVEERCNLTLSSFPTGDQFSQLQHSVYLLFPKISLIVLTYNNLNYTRQCLESIFEKTSYPNFEVVIVDNASTDGTPQYLQSFAETHPQVKLVLNRENRGFAAGNNQGVQASTGEIVVFLNNDIVVTYGWLSRLVSHLRSPVVGAVGPVTNYAGNESRISVTYSDISGLDDFARGYTRLHVGLSFEIRMLALFCMAMRRTVIDAVGLLDERFNVGMYEDDDFSLRIRQKGYHILCAEDVYIHHWGSASFSQLAAERYQRLHEENRAKFEEKWGTRWQPHRWRMEEG